MQKNNDVLKNVIKRIENELKKIDENYRFHDGFNYSCKVSLHYNCDYKLDITLHENVIYSSDVEFIYDFFNKKVKDYLNTVIPFDNYLEIKNILSKIEEKYNRIIFKDKNSYQVKVSKGKYETKYKLEDRFHEVRHKRIAEDMINIEVGINTNNGYNHYHIYLYQDKIYVLTNFDYQFVLKIISGEVESFFKFNMTNLENLLQKILREQIYNSLNGKVCTDCSNKIDMNVGEIKFYIDKDLLFPKRCKSCRDKKKLIKQ